MVRMKPQLNKHVDTMQKEVEKSQKETSEVLEAAENLELNLKGIKFWIIGNNCYFL